MQKEAPSVIRNKELPRSMDYQLLRKEAIAMTQQMSGNNWTDYNVHDPGVTILEQFCYALTDIAYRTNLDIETLLFHTGNHKQTAKSNALFPAEEIFPPNALTLNDYRILILDELPNKISNCWVSRVTNHREGLQGLFEMAVVLKNDVSLDEHQEIKSSIETVFNENRNLCEDLHQINILESEKLCFSVEIEIHQDQIAHEILAEILFEIENYLNPPVKFSTLDDLEKEGLDLDEIFDIPSHKHGFITKAQLRSKRNEFYVSKLADYILGVKGVRSLTNLNVTLEGVPIYGDIISVPVNKYLTLGFLKVDHDTVPFQGFDIKIYKGGVLNNYLEEFVLHALQIIENKTHRSYEILTSPKVSNEQVATTNELIDYESIQGSFPEIYRIGKYSATQEEGKERMALSKQLKGYLMFFDQVMTNHLAQLANISKLFSIEAFDSERVQTYFAQNLSSDQFGLDELLKKNLQPRSELLKQLAELELLAPELISDHEKIRLENLKLDLTRKEALAKRLAEEKLDGLLKIPIDKLPIRAKIADQKCLMMVITYKQLSDETISINDKLDRVSDPQDREGLETTLNSIDKESRDKRTEIVRLFSEDLMEENLAADLSQRDLDTIMLGFDTSVKRKDRILSHLLARFGEQFTTDFHIKFSNLTEGESQERIDKKLIDLKASFLRNIVSLSRFRSQGTKYSRTIANASSENPLKSRISLLLNIDHQSYERLIPDDFATKIKVNKISGVDILSEESTEDAPAHIKTSGKSAKVRFIIPGTAYYKYLFKFGLQESNYKVVLNQDKYQLYFQSPSNESLTLIAEVDSKPKAKETISALIQYLKKINAQNEGFHLVEHILLRPKKKEDFHFFLHQNGESLFKSCESNESEKQERVAMDTLLLACFSNNYKLSVNKEGKCVVFIKSQVGKELAFTPAVFPSRKIAQKFIETSVSFYNQAKDQDELLQSYYLDNEQKYHFEILGDKKNAIFKSLEVGEIPQQGRIVQRLQNFLANEDNYVVVSDGNTYKVEVLNYEYKALALSVEEFKEEKIANLFVLKCVKYFGKLSKKQYDLGVSYPGLNSRKAEDFNHQLSIVYPNWTSRFSNQEFLHLFKQTLFESAPAHLAMRLIGLDYEEMKEFENTYFKYLESSVSNGEEDVSYETAVLSSDLLNILTAKQVSF